MKAFGKLFVSASILVFCYGCFDNGKETGGAFQYLFAVLGLSSGNPNPEYLILGRPVDLDGNGSLDGTPVDVNADGELDGIDINGNQLPEMLLADSNSDGKSDALDIDGNGSSDFSFCFQSGKLSLTSEQNCNGSKISILDGNGDSLPDGFDTNEDGSIDNSILSQLRTDLTPPTIYRTAGNPPGTYTSPQSITITCSDSIGPAGVLYSLDGSEPSFQTRNSIYVRKPSLSIRLGTFADGQSLIKYKCIDLAGNQSGTHSDLYQVRTSGISVSLSVSSKYISANGGAINSSNIKWSSNNNGYYTIRDGGANCAEGTEMFSGSNQFNQEVNNSVNAVNHFSREGQKTFTVYSYFDNNSNGLCDPLVDLIGSNHVTVHRDDTPPNVTTTPAPGNYTTDKSVALVCADQIGGVGCDKVVYTLRAGSSPADPVINASTGTISSGIKYFAPYTLSDNTVHYFRYLARDLAGNVSQVVESVFALDKSVAQIKLYLPPEYLNQSTNPTLEWRSDRVGNYEIRIDGNDCSEGTVVLSGSVGAFIQMYSVIPNSNIGPNFSTVRVCVKSAVQTGSASFLVTRDDTVPSVSMSPNGGNFPSATNIQLSCNDTISGGSRILITSDGSDPNFGSIGTPLHGTEPLNGIVVMGHGSFTLKAICQDKAGNVSSIESAAFTSSD
ncbi:hypothetical protein CH373_12495 [Leptospira perolatii]|uniref:GH29D-like beta-sandwich domain-containing protein n=1 Tax=Leptospira perolatii TaxID=2023191 RepID=A0A2M9ZLL1_9LEPT|nr:chitobiase/beta-hexosaminidase C-terminal domain-containing protein [Leptospira perolatii]PJZ70245.1 hypothetical protein CH360_06475 [Leptospira perolatii]PJZ72871.1 hypothetical protein CH373_12495 [Leptospira perolatii]